MSPNHSIFYRNENCNIVTNKIVRHANTQLNINLFYFFEICDKYSIIMSKSLFFLNKHFFLMLIFPRSMGFFN